MATELLGPLVYDALRSRLEGDARRQVEPVMDELVKLVEEVLKDNGVIEIPGIGLFGNDVAAMEEIRDQGKSAAVAKKAAARARRRKDALAKKRTGRPIAKVTKDLRDKVDTKTKPRPKGSMKIKGAKRGGSRGGIA